MLFIVNSKLMNIGIKFYKRREGGSREGVDLFLGVQLYYSALFCSFLLALSSQLSHPTDSSVSSSERLVKGCIYYDYLGLLLFIRFDPTHLGDIERDRARCL